VRRLAKGLREEEAEDIPRLHALSSRILAEVPYEIGPTDAATTAEEAIEHGSGVCQDHAISSSPPPARWATPRAMSRAT
jgi:transglutaminase-like putative cysteine protease